MVRSTGRGSQSRLSYNSRYTESFQRYVEALHEVYAPVDAKRPISDVALNLVLHSSKVSEAVRRNQHDEVATRLSDVLAWLMGLTERLQAIGRRSETSDALKVALQVIGSLDRAVWFKYPGYCPVCIGRLFHDVRIAEGTPLFEAASDEQRRRVVDVTHQKIAERKISEPDRLPDSPIMNCECLTTPGTEDRDKAEEEDRKKWRRHYAETYIDEMPSGIGAWETMFKRIFGLNAEKSTLDAVAFHLGEEVGEVAECVTLLYTYDTRREPPDPHNSLVNGAPTPEALNHRIVELSEEIADALSWTFSLMFKIKEPFIAVNNYTSVISRKVSDIDSVIDHLNVTDLFWDRYGDIGSPSGRLHCPACREHTCDEHIKIIDSMLQVLAPGP